jgi:hypothetical protein
VVPGLLGSVSSGRSPNPPVPSLERQTRLDAGRRSPPSVLRSPASRPGKIAVRASSGASASDRGAWQRRLRRQRRRFAAPVVRRRDPGTDLRISPRALAIATCVRSVSATVGRCVATVLVRAAAFRTRVMSAPRSHRSSRALAPRLLCVLAEPFPGFAAAVAALDAGFPTGAGLDRGHCQRSSGAVSRDLRG